MDDQAVHMEEIIKFSQASKFSKMITSLLMGLRHDSEDLSILRDLFHKIDIDNNGTISKDEFEKAADELHDMHFFNFKDINTDEVFKQIDLDGDGSVDFHEFCVAAVDHKKFLSKQNLQIVFNTLDKDHSGQIDLDEFKNQLPSNFKQGKNYLETGRNSAFRKAKENLNDNRSNSGSVRSYFKDTKLQGEEDRVDQKWHEIIKSVDKDGDGKIDFDEFQSAITLFLDEELKHQISSTVLSTE